MDSDEGQLIIDEDLLVETNPPSSPQIIQMEVADTSQDESNGTNSAQSETNSDKSSEPTEKQKTKESEKSPKHSKPSSSSLHRHSSSHKSSSRKESSHERHKSSSHERRIRSKERHSHGDKEKKASSTSHDAPKKDKRISQTNWFKLSHLSDFAAKELNISALKHQFYNMRLHVHRDKMLVCEMADVYPPPPTMADINLKQLFNWPGISFTIYLEHFSIAYEFKTNTERDIVIGDNDYINLRKDENNNMETRYVQNVASKKDQKTVSKDMLRCYLEAILQAAPLHDVPRTKLSETAASFRKILALISTVDDDFIEIKTTHSRLMNKYKYVRIIDNHTDQSRPKKAKIREIINPECNFRIERCSLSMEQVDVWLDAVETYFEEICIKLHGQDAKLLKDRLKKCLTMRCELCNLLFEGAMSTVSMKEHVKDKHFFDKPWECTFCNRSWTQFELTEMDWKHECKIVQHEEEATITSSQG